MKKRLYIDMDEVLCDFKSAYRKELLNNPSQRYPQSQYGFFLNLEPIKDSIDSVNFLKEHFDTWVLSSPSAKNLNCYTEKAAWVRNHLGFEMQTKLILSIDKSLLKGHFLVDDQNQESQKNFEGIHIHFGSKNFEDWPKVVEYLMSSK